MYFLLKYIYQHCLGLWLQRSGTNVLFNKNSFGFKSSLKPYILIAETPQNTDNQKQRKVSSYCNPHKDNYIVYSVWYLSFSIHIACVIISYVIISSLLSSLHAELKGYTRAPCLGFRVSSCDFSIFLLSLLFLLLSFLLNVWLCASYFTSLCLSFFKYL